MNDNPPNNPIDAAAPLDEELVAYLDGELDAESGRRIEAQLAADPAVRFRLQSLERTWDLLDELDAAAVGEPFTQTTLEMVAIAAQQEVDHRRAEAPRRRRRWLAAFGCGLLAAAAAGFFAVALHDPDRRLLEDLPLLENLDEYRQIGSIEFLHRLRDEGLFSKTAAKPAAMSAVASASGDEDLPLRRQQVRSMSLDQKEQLVRAQERLAGLSSADQQHLRRLHAELTSDRDAAQLRVIMHAYHQWLQRLPAVVWMELAEGKTSQRIDQVKKRLQEQQQREGGWRPSAKDLAALRRWLDDCAARHEADFVKSLLNDAERKEFAERGKTVRHQIVLASLRRQWQFPAPGKLPAMMTEQDLARLREKLSPEARKRLEDKTPAEQSRAAATWLRQEFRRAFEQRRFRGPLSQDDDERLAEFFEKVLTNQQRDRLLAMPAEEMQWELQQLYWTHNRPQDGPGRRGDRPGDPDWPGPAWFGPGGPGPRPPGPGPED